MPLQVDVVTIERRVYSAEDVEMVIAPGSEGEMGVLPRHEPLVTALKEGELEIVRPGARDILAIGGGYMQVRPSHVVIMADVAEQADEIDLERAEAARRRAEERLREAPKDVDAAQALAALRRAQVRLKVARRHRRRTGSRTGPGRADSSEG
jgi:F-type H+-transporting ATPase subunit epsilon